MQWWIFSASTQRWKGEATNSLLPLLKIKFDQFQGGLQKARETRQEQFINILEKHNGRLREYLIH